MTTEDKIKQLQHGYPDCDFNFNDGYSEGLKDASAVAKEADITIERLVDALQKMYEIAQAKAANNPHVVMVGKFLQELEEK